MTDFDERLVSCLTSKNAVGNLETYFGSYEGRNFELVGGPGDAPDIQDSVTAIDLVAVQMLSVTIPAPTSAALLLDTLGEDLGGLLARIPIDVDMGTEDATKHLAPGSAADDAWTLLRAQTGMGRTKTSKLLARKRPRLIPVMDAVVDCRLGKPELFWQSLHAALLVPKVRDQVFKLRRDAGLGPDVSDLRVIDVIVWMDHQEAHRKRQCARVS